MGSILVPCRLMFIKSQWAKRKSKYSLSGLQGIQEKAEGGYQVALLCERS